MSQPKIFFEHFFFVVKQKGHIFRRMKHMTIKASISCCDTLVSIFFLMVGENIIKNYVLNKGALFTRSITGLNLANECTQCHIKIVTDHEPPIHFAKWCLK